MKLRAGEKELLKENKKRKTESCREKQGEENHNGGRSLVITALPLVRQVGTTWITPWLPPLTTRLSRVAIRNGEAGSGSGSVNSSFQHKSTLDIDCDSDRRMRKRSEPLEVAVWQCAR